MVSLNVDIGEAATGFAAIGSEARLAVLRALVRAGPASLSVGAIQAATGMAPSTLAHHLRALRDAGIVMQEKTGRAVVSRADFDRLEALAHFILDECCADMCSADTRIAN